jgi:hypothetical protein
MSLAQDVRPIVRLDTVADLNYLLSTTERPRTYTYDPPDGEPRTNAAHTPHRVTIRDIRPKAESYTLDTHGFAVAHHQSMVRDFWDEAQIRDVYYPEAERLIREATGADRVFIFDHTLRRRVSGAEDDRNGPVPRQPATRVHVDHTEKSAPQRVRDFLPDEADELLKGRVQVINLWRPLHGPLWDAPLAVCDARSVDLADLVPSDLVYPDRVGETYSVAYNPAHKWYYLSAMQPDEALLLKCTDTRTDVAARFMPHTAFIHPDAPANARPRESIELRTLVFHH